ncbi:MAG: hypothetical protein AAF289_22455 [Cyanobacteria bacterium P01_A01_bin.135]
MNIIRQADRQWLNYLYSLSPDTAFDYFLFRTYHRLKRSRRSPDRDRQSTTQVTSTCDRYGSPMWHAYNSALNTGFSTYSEQELRRWCHRFQPSPPRSASA